MRQISERLERFHGRWRRHCSPENPPGDHALLMQLPLPKLALVRLQFQL
jgi:hypothetical protein